MHVKEITKKEEKEGKHFFQSDQIYIILIFISFFMVLLNFYILYIPLQFFFFSTYTFLE